MADVLYAPLSGLTIDPFVPLGSYTVRGDDRRSSFRSDGGHVGCTHIDGLARSRAVPPSDVHSEAVPTHPRLDHVRVAGRSLDAAFHTDPVSSLTRPQDVPRPDAAITEHEMITESEGTGSSTVTDSGASPLAWSTYVTRPRVRRVLFELDYLHYNLINDCKPLPFYDRESPPSSVIQRLDLRASSDHAGDPQTLYAPP